MSNSFSFLSLWHWLDIVGSFYMLCNENKLVVSYHVFEGLSLWSNFIFFWLRHIKLFFALCTYVCSQKHVCFFLRKRTQNIHNHGPVHWGLLSFTTKIRHISLLFSISYSWEEDIFALQNQLWSNNQRVIKWHLNLHLIKRFSLLYTVAWKI